jgi:hypothetical protein
MNINYLIPIITNKNEKITNNRSEMKQNIISMIKDKIVPFFIKVDISF